MANSREERVTYRGRRHSRRKRLARSEIGAAAGAGSFVAAYTLPVERREDMTMRPFNATDPSCQIAAGQRVSFVEGCQLLCVVRSVVVGGVL